MYLYEQRSLEECLDYLKQIEPDTNLQSHQVDLEQISTILKMTKDRILLERGNCEFKSGNYEDALNTYSRCETILASSTDLESSNSELQTINANLKFQILHNTSLCFIKLTKFDEAHDYLNRALNLKATNVTGICNKGKLLLMMEHIDLAHEQFQLALGHSSFCLTALKCKCECELR